MADERSGFRFGLRCDSSPHGDARKPFGRRSLGLCGLSRQAARRRDLQHGGYRPVGLFAVLHAKRVVPRPPARAGGRAEEVERQKPVRHDRRPDRQPYPRHARPSASLAPAARLRPKPGYAAPARWAARLPAARRPCADRARRHGILLLAKARLSAVPDAPAWQRQDRELYSVHVRTRKLHTSERPLLPGSTRQPLFGFSRGRSIVLAPPRKWRSAAGLGRTAEGAQSRPPRPRPADRAGGVPAEWLSAMANGDPGRSGRRSRR